MKNITTNTLYKIFKYKIQHFSFLKRKDFFSILKKITNGIKFFDFREFEFSLIFDKKWISDRLRFVYERMGDFTCSFEKKEREFYRILSDISFLIKNEKFREKIPLFFDFCLKNRLMTWFGLDITDKLFITKLYFMPLSPLQKGQINNFFDICEYDIRSLSHDLYNNIFFWGINFFNNNEKEIKVYSRPYENKQIFLCSKICSNKIIERRLIYSFESNGLKGQQIINFLNELGISKKDINAFFSNAIVPFKNIDFIVRSISQKDNKKIIYFSYYNLE